MPRLTSLIGALMILYVYFVNYALTDLNNGTLPTKRKNWSCWQGRASPREDQSPPSMTPERLIQSKRPIDVCGGNPTWQRTGLPRIRGFALVVPAPCAGQIGITLAIWCGFRAKSRLEKQATVHYSLPYHLHASPQKRPRSICNRSRHLSCSPFPYRDHLKWTRK